MFDQQLEAMSDSKRLLVVSGFALVVIVIILVFVLHWAMHAELTLVCAQELGRQAVELCEDWYVNVAHNQRREMYDCFFFTDRANGSIDVFNCLVEKGLGP